MSPHRQPSPVQRVAYPLCITSITLLVPVTIAGIWLESANDTLWKLAATLGIVAFASALALSASRAARGSGDRAS